MDPKLEKDLKKIETELGDIREHTTPVGWWPLLYGFLQGIGWIAGSLTAVTLIGWLLSKFGVIPGMGTIAAQLQDALHGR